MNAKRIVTTVLLAFVAFSIAAVAYREYRDRTAPVARPADAPTTTDATTRQVVAYYFHGNVRCVTCRTIEALAHAAITNGFAAALQRGTLAWRVVNVEEPGQEHFVTDFNLTTRAVVLAQFANGRPTRSVTLQRVWELVGDDAAFTAYVQSNVLAYLEAR